MSDIEFTDGKLNMTNKTLSEQYAKAVETQTANIELRIYEGEWELTENPALYPEYDKNHFATSSGRFWA